MEPIRRRSTLWRVLLFFILITAFFDLVIMATMPKYKSASTPADGARVFSDLPALLQAARALPDGSLCVIGGASVYAALLDYCSMAYVTKTFLSPPADRFFPDLDALPQWSVVERSPLQEENGVTYQYINYQKTRSARETVLCVVSYMLPPP